MAKEIYSIYMTHHLCYIWQVYCNLCQPNNQQGSPTKLEQVPLRVATNEWVIAKYILDNGLTVVTSAEIKFVLGSRNPFAQHSVVKNLVRDGLLVKTKRGTYLVNKERLIQVLQLIPFDIGKRVQNQGPVPEWREAVERAKGWNMLKELAQKLQEASEGTSPPTPQPPRPEAVEVGLPLPSPVSYFPIESVPTPSGMNALVVVLGDKYVLLEGINGSRYMYCVPFDCYRPGARLCSPSISVLVKYTSRVYPGEGGGTGAEGSKANPSEGAGSAGALAVSTAVVAGGGSQGQSEGRQRNPAVQGTVPGSAQALAGLPPGRYNITVEVKEDGSVVLEGDLPLDGMGTAGVIPGIRGDTLLQSKGTLIRRVDPIPWQAGAPDVGLVFDNVRFWDGERVVQLHGLQPMDTVLRLGQGLVYAEPGLQIHDPVLYELSKVMDIHIYHSRGKDPKGTVRVEARPRARALRKLGLAGVIQLFVTYMHRLSGWLSALAFRLSRFI